MTKAEGGIKVIDLLTGELVSNHHLFLNKVYGTNQETPVQRIYKKLTEEINRQLDNKLTIVEKETRKQISKEEEKLQEQKNEFWKKRMERKQARRMDA